MLNNLNSISKNLNSFSYKNAISNGNFTSTSSWTATGSVLSASNYIMTITANGTQAYGMMFQNSSAPIVVGNKIYVSLKAKVTNSLSTFIYAQILGSVTGSSTIAITQASPIEYTTYSLSGIATVPSNSTGNVRVRIQHLYSSSTVANNKVMEVQDFFTIDLTSLYGAGKEPNATDCANIFRFTETTKQPSLSKIISA